VSAQLEVAIDVTPLAGQRTGIARSVAELLNGLALLDTPPRIHPYAISTRARKEREQLPAGTTILPGAGALVSMWSRSDRPKIDRAFGGASVVHATNFLVPPTKIPVLATLHDGSIVRHRSLCSPAVQALEPILRRAIDRGVHLHVPSEFVAREAEEIFGPGLRSTGRIHVVHWGVPVLAPALGVPSEIAKFGPIANGVPYIVAVGTLEPRKNFAHLVAAFGNVATIDRDVHLVIVGADGSARPEVDQAIARLPPDTAGRVVLTGAVGEPAKGWLVRNARALAYPSVYEGFGFPILEAMSVGVPVLSANTGSIPEISGGACVLVEPTDETAMARALVDLLGDEAHRTKLIELGHAQSLQFSWVRCAEDIAALYQLIAR
jgi:glycosyltransferase involved in cell wall biosynthesis